MLKAFSIFNLNNLFILNHLHINKHDIFFNLFILFKIEKKKIKKFKIG
jgi:hypothetical protein